MDFQCPLAPQLFFSGFPLLLETILATSSWPRDDMRLGGIREAYTIFLYKIPDGGNCGWYPIKMRIKICNCGCQRDAKKYTKTNWRDTVDLHNGGRNPMVNQKFVLITGVRKITKWMPKVMRNGSGTRGAGNPRSGAADSMKTNTNTSELTSIEWTW